jgi:hypothetical protein
MIPLLDRLARAWMPEWQEELAERWAIMQHLGGMDEDTAHREAFACVGERMEAAREQRR